MATTLYPTSDVTVQCTPSTGSNYTCVDETVLDTADYNYTTSNSDTVYVVAYDEFGFPDTTEDAPITGITINAYAATGLITTGDGKIKFHVTISGTKYYSDEFNVPAVNVGGEIGSYSFSYTWALNPATSGVWTKTAVNALVAGYTLSIRGTYNTDSGGSK